jgi:hypothetical protein
MNVFSILSNVRPNYERVATDGKHYWMSMVSLKVKPTK